MKKKLFIFVVLILLLTSAGPALAKGGRSSMILVGYIADIDYSEQSLVLTVVKANKSAKSFIGNNESIFTHNQTSIRVRLEDDTVQEISFSDLQVGYVVSVSAHFDNDRLVADRIIWEMTHSP